MAGASGTREQAVAHANFRRASSPVQPAHRRIPRMDIFARVLHESGSADETHEQIGKPFAGLAQRAFDMQQQHDTGGVAIVPHFVAIGVVEYQHLALFPADELVGHPHPHIAVTGHDQPQMAGDQRLGNAAVIRNMGAGRQD